MKQILENLGLTFLKAAIATIVFILGAYQGVEAWVEIKIDQSIERVITIRNGDMALIDSRLKGIEEDTKIIKEHLLRGR